MSLLINKYASLTKDDMKVCVCVCVVCARTCVHVRTWADILPERMMSPGLASRS